MNIEWSCYHEKDLANGNDNYPLAPSDVEAWDA